MKPNIGIINALVRITCGFTMLAWGISKLTRCPWHTRYLVLAMLGGMKIGEGITRFCPLTALFEQYQEKNENDQQKQLPDVINPT